ncbi:unnamed protein product [Prorocentrum cordatum]|uniref:BD-FAE-like domain-containing protein n=1 Tax=Prorocentrum cordatum TaxID=2364126 RepID=A0ABN9T2D4_9DINO|nr:unnamed protein product [Polarella glacialis]
MIRALSSLRAPLAPGCHAVCAAWWRQPFSSDLPRGRCCGSRGALAFSRVCLGCDGREPLVEPLAGSHETGRHGGSRSSSATSCVTSMASVRSAVAQIVCRGCHFLRAVLTTLVMGVRLGLFSLLLLVPFLRVGRKYFVDSRISRGIRFGARPRQLLDIYCPEGAPSRECEGYPVVVAVMGGAWVIGHRAWNAQLGQRVMDAGAIMVAIDYRNYPFSCVADMLEDLDAGLAWVFQNVASYGGDPTNVVLTGQSAGAHLTSLLLLRRSLQEAQNEADDPEAAAASEAAVERLAAGPHAGAWSPRDLRGYVGVSGPYCMSALAQRLEARWLGSWLLWRVCAGNLDEWSPLALVQSEAWRAVGPRAAAARLPKMKLFHGAKDKTVPASSSVEFAAALQREGVQAEDYQIQLLLPFLRLPGGAVCDDWLRTLPPLRPMFPRMVIRLASRLMPF